MLFQKRTSEKMGIGILRWINRNGNRRKKENKNEYFLRLKKQARLAFFLFALDKVQLV